MAKIVFRHKVTESETAILNASFPFIMLPQLVFVGKTMIL